MDDVTPLLAKVQNFHNKSSWLLEIADLLKDEINIPQSIEELVTLKGIGHKSANVIMRESKVAAEGIVCDLHVIRVYSRLGLIQEAKDGNKVEKQLMEILLEELWRTNSSIIYLPAAQLKLLRLNWCKIQSSLYALVCHLLMK